MCGISGLIQAGNRPVDVEVLERMTDIMQHRGPDGRGFVLLDPIRREGVFFAQTPPAPGICARSSLGLGHRRLSIIDLEGGVQPMTNEDGTVWIVFNGEIYNFQDLRQTLSRLGHCFRTDHSDTEVILHAYEEWGEACLEHFRGMFAFGLVDLKRQRLLLARDRVGKKPLVYYATADRLVFASEIKGLLEDPTIPREIELSALADYFAYDYIPSPKTIFKHIHKLNPGHYLSVDLHDLAGACPARSVAYWDLAFEPDESVSEEEWCERLRAELLEATRLRLISDVPLGAFLSGGVDSSTIVALMSRLQEKPVKTFSIGFAEASHNETPYARQVAAQYRTEHYEEIVRPDALAMLPKLAWQYDEPFADASALPTYYVAQMARRQVTVALSGDGGDENFAGYRRHGLALRFHNWVDWAPHPLRRVIFGGLFHLAPKAGRTKQYLDYFAQSADERFAKVVYSPAGRQLLRSEVRDQIGQTYENPAFARCWRQGDWDYTARMQYFDIKTYLAEDILVKVDKASMLNSLEVRNPFLDHKVIELAARIPSCLKLKGYDKKYILKKMMIPELGRDFLYRKKWGFGMPLGRWFKEDLGDYLQDTLLGTGSFTSAYIDNTALRRMIAQHRIGKRDFSNTLWSVLFLEQWGRIFYGKGQK